MKQLNQFSELSTEPLKPDTMERRVFLKRAMGAILAGAFGGELARDASPDTAGQAESGKKLEQEGKEEIPLADLYSYASVQAALEIADESFPKVFQSLVALRGASYREAIQAGELAIIPYSEVKRMCSAYPFYGGSVAGTEKSLEDLKQDLLGVIGQAHTHAFDVLMGLDQIDNDSSLTLKEKSKQRLFLLDGTAYEVEKAVSQKFRISPIIFTGFATHADFLWASTFLKCKAAEDFLPLHLKAENLWKALDSYALKENKQGLVDLMKIIMLNKEAGRLTTLGDIDTVRNMLSGSIGIRETDKDDNLRSLFADCINYMRYRDYLDP